jgi:hypothetical protein
MHVNIEWEILLYYILFEVSGLHEHLNSLSRILGGHLERRVSSFWSVEGDVLTDLLHHSV